MWESFEANGYELTVGDHPRRYQKLNTNVSQRADKKYIYSEKCTHKRHFQRVKQNAIEIKQ